MVDSSSLVQEITAAAGNPEALQSKLRSVFTDAVGQIFKVGKKERENIYVPKKNKKQSRLDEPQLTSLDDTLSIDRSIASVCSYHSIFPFLFFSSPPNSERASPQYLQVLGGLLAQQQQQSQSQQQHQYQRQYCRGRLGSVEIGGREWHRRNTIQGDLEESGRETREGAVDVSPTTKKKRQSESKGDWKEETERERRFERRFEDAIQTPALPPFGARLIASPDALCSSGALAWTRGREPPREARRPEVQP